ncbi:hypothetical protein [Corynebacterium urealyticum]|uniref:hypothetical protein n=1 Tax=Corynebacterium urealyticum TaxID=43771 RepID=UPI001653EE22|nr:hypothetical protein [Corynebacterium urealyticum]
MTRPDPLDHIDSWLDEDWPQHDGLDGLEHALVLLALAGLGLLIAAVIIIQFILWIC